MTVDHLRFQVYINYVLYAKYLYGQPIPSTLPLLFDDKYFSLYISLNLFLLISFNEKLYKNNRISVTDEVVIFMHTASSRKVSFSINVTFL